MTITPPDQWLAGFVTRWHSGPSAPYLAHTQDRICGHQGRMAVLALHYWPNCTRELLVACVVHDVGEYGVADVPWGAKHDQAFKNMLDNLEAASLTELGLMFYVSEQDAKRLKFLDRLDAYLWAQLYAPQVLSTPDWQGCFDNLQTMADDLGVMI